VEPDWLVLNQTVQPVLPPQVGWTALRLEAAWAQQVSRLLALVEQWERQVRHQPVEQASPLQVRSAELGQELAKHLSTVQGALLVQAHFVERQ